MGAPQLTFVNNQAPQCGAESLNAFTQEINNLVTSMGLEINETSFEQIANGIIKGIATGNFYEYSGTENAVVLTSLGSKTAALTYYDGMQAAFISTLTNTGAATINIDGIGVKNIKDQDGNDLVGGEISGYMKLVYRTDDDFFTLVTTSVHEQPERTDELIKILLSNGDAVIYPSERGSYASVGGNNTLVGATHLVCQASYGLIVLEIIGAPATGTITALDLDSRPRTLTLDSTTTYNLRHNNIASASYTGGNLSTNPWYWINSDGFTIVGGVTNSLGINGSEHWNFPITLTTVLSLSATPAISPGTGTGATAGAIFSSNSSVDISNPGTQSTYSVYWLATGWIAI